jgi:hypothetical protein
MTTAAFALELDGVIGPKASEHAYVRHRRYRTATKSASSLLTPDSIVAHFDRRSIDVSADLNPHTSSGLLH